MGLFGRSTPAPETPLPIPRATRVWPKAVPVVKAVPPPPPPPPLVAQPAPRAVAGPPRLAPAAPPTPRVAVPAPVSAPAPAAVVKAPAPPPAVTVAAPTSVKPVEVPPPSANREASSVVAAFASWKQATAAKTAVAGKTETAPADSTAISPRPAPSTASSGRREDPVMYVYRAAAKQARGEHDAAIEDLTKAIEIDPTCTTAWAGRALSLEAKGDLAGAKRDYAKSIEIELKQEIARLARPL